MLTHGNGIVLGVFLLVLLLVGASGILASRWHSTGHGALEEWGLGGRQFGTLVTWFLVGGDFYTAYTIIAVPALVFATGAAGFFALPYTIIVYPFVFATMPRLWSVSRAHGLVTPADFVRVRYGSRWLATAVAATGVIALMPYIALQLTGIEVVLAQMGFTGSTALLRAMPIILAFACVATFTYTAGLRAPASIAFAKDTMIYIVVLAAVFLLPRHFGGYHTIFAHAADHFARTGTGSVILMPAGFSAYATLALGSALAAFMYPHTVTSVLASGSSDVIRRNAVLLPAYTFLLGLVALLGIVGAAAGLHLHSAKDLVPALFSLVFPRWFLGFAFAAIAVAALVPAAIMSIAAANLFSRNIYKEYLRPDASPSSQAQIAKYSSLAVNAGALLFVLFVPMQYAINLQLIGGVLILQTLPAIVFGLWKRLFHHGALLGGWVVSMGFSLWLLAKLHFQSAIYPIAFGNHIVPMYIGVIALGVNLILTTLMTLLLDAAKVARLPDATQPEEYN
ncbi:MAG: sodium:solute symporter [Acidobacteriaceae bacterium]|nr:sodium:solute symporter [Acidobacteriaceae bacterium]